MKKTYFIIGDIHGEADMMEEMLQNWDEETQQLVFMGDLIDRGPDNKRSVLTGMKYAKEKNAWYLMGNHEVMFLAFIDDPEGRFHTTSETMGIRRLTTYSVDHKGLRSILWKMPKRLKHNIQNSSHF